MVSRVYLTYSFAKTPFNAAKVPLVTARMTQGDVEDGFGCVSDILFRLCIYTGFVMQAIQYMM